MSNVENVVPAPLAELFDDVAACWSAESSVGDRWGEPGMPIELGQCAVTAMVVQDVFGGELLRGVVIGEGSHYWNLIGGVEVDFTRAQFGAFGLDGAVETRERAYLESSADTVARYEILRDAVAKASNLVPWG